MCSDECANIQDAAKAIEQLAVYPPGREALLHDPSVTDALQEVADKGWTDEAREHAAGALMALSDQQPAPDAVAFPERHLMMSCAFVRVCSDCMSLYLSACRSMGRPRDRQAHSQRAPGSRVQAMVRFVQVSLKTFALPVEILTICRLAQHEGQHG